MNWPTSPLAAVPWRLKGIESKDTTHDLCLGPSLTSQHSAYKKDASFCSFRDLRVVCRKPNICFKTSLLGFEKGEEPGLKREGLNQIALMLKIRLVSTANARGYSSCVRTCSVCLLRQGAPE